MKCQLLKTASAQLFMMAAIATAIPKQEQSQKVDPRAIHSPQPCNPGPSVVTLGESELTGLPHNNPAGFHLHTAHWFNLDSYLKGTDGLCLSNNHLKGKIGSAEPWICL